MDIKGPYRHVHLVSQDPGTTAQWYVQNLGGRIARDADVRGSRRVRIELGEARLNIRGLRPGETIATPGEGQLLGIDHFALSVDELEGMMDELKKNGVMIVEPIFTTPDGGRALFIEGPEGVLVEIMEAS